MVQAVPLHRSISALPRPAAPPTAQPSVADTAATSWNELSVPTAWLGITVQVAAAAGLVVASRAATMVAEWRYWLSLNWR